MDVKMRRVDKEITDRAWIDGVLDRATVIQIAMAGEDGWPYIVPMGFGYDGKSIYLHGANKGLKNDLICANPKVCFQVSLDTEVVSADVGSEFTMKYRSVTGFGRATVLKDRDEKDRALVEIMRHYNGPHTPLGENHEKIWVVRIDVERVTGKNSFYPKPGE